MNKRTHRHVWIAILIVAMIALGYALRAIHRSHEHADAVSDSGKMAQIAVALHSYHEEYGSFPPAYVVSKSGARHSWRVLILEFLDPHLYSQYDFRQPWNGLINEELADDGAFYYCFNNTLDRPNRNWTSCVAIVGSETAFPGVNCTRLDQLAREGILVLETSRSGIHWMEPRDYPIVGIGIGEVIDSRNVSSISPNHLLGPKARLVDGTQLYFSQYMSDDDLLERINCRIRP